MESTFFIVLGVILAIVALGFFSTMRFNRKKPMTREEYEEYERAKKDYKYKK